MNKTLEKILWVAIAMWCGIIIGIASAVNTYQTKYNRLLEVCSPYNCDTDTSCEEQEQRKKELWKKLNTPPKFM
jgi:hypothetical protein